MVQTFRQSLLMSSSDDFTLKKEAAGFSEDARTHIQTHAYRLINNFIINNDDNVNT
jgi:hypothetical protein